MPGFLGGFASGLANRLDKAATDYNKEKSDIAKEQRQDASKEALRQRIRQEEFFSQNPDADKPFLMILPGADGKPISMLEGAQAEQAAEHNKRREQGLLSTAAENERKLVAAEEYATQAKAWRAANPKDYRTYDQYVKDTESKRDFGEAIALQENSGLVSRKNAAFNNSLPSKDGSGSGKDKWASKPIIKGIYNNAVSGKYTDQGIGTAAKAVGLKDYNVTKLIRMLALADGGDPNAREMVERMAPYLRSIDNVSGATRVPSANPGQAIQDAIANGTVIQN